MRTHLRIHDDESDVPQPSGSVGLDVPESATDEEIIVEIERTWADPSRPHVIDFKGGWVNPRLEPHLPAPAQGGVMSHLEKRVEQLEELARTLALHLNLFVCDRCLAGFSPDHHDKRHGLEFLCVWCAYHNSPRPRLRAL